jgi:23S rRNA (adenine2503-C2)-methyltransferase
MHARLVFGRKAWGRSSKTNEEHYFCTVGASKKDIRTLDLSQLQDFFLENGEKKFRAKQVWEWLWKKGAHSFEEMTNLSLGLRTMLSENFDLVGIELAEQQISSDRTIKCAFDGGGAYSYEI